MRAAIATAPAAGPLPGWPPSAAGMQGTAAGFTAGRPGIERRPGAAAADDPIRLADPAAVMAMQGERNAVFLAPVLPARSIMLLRGPRGIGLSHVMVGCAVALANGGSFLGWRAPRPVRVLLLAGNLPTPVLASRLSGALASERRNGDLPERLRMVTRDGYNGCLPDLGTYAGLAQLMRACNQIDVLMIDDLGAFLTDAGSELRGRLGLLSTYLGGARACGRSVVVAQHSAPRLPADRVALREAESIADVVVGLHRPADYHVRQGARFELRVERAAHLSGADRAARVMQLVQAADGRPKWVEEDAEDVRKLSFFGLLDDGVAVEAAAREVGIGRSTAYRWRRQWQAQRAETAAT
jgi:hypothetical protein